MTYTYVLTDPPPSVNDIYCNVSDKMRAALLAKGKRVPGRIKTKEYKGWRQAACYELVSQRNRMSATTIRKRVAVRIDLPMKTRGDASNREKAALDALQDAKIIANDSQCDPVSIGRADVARTTITIEVPE